eukprot:2920240-Pyramimonas_sp.AAC.1
MAPSPASWFHRPGGRGERGRKHVVRGFVHTENPELMDNFTHAFVKISLEVHYLMIPQNVIPGAPDGAEFAVLKRFHTNVELEAKRRARAQQGAAAAGASADANKKAGGGGGGG